MKAMLWKEWRENLKWAALGSLCLLFAEIYTLSAQRQHGTESYYNLTVCSSAFLLVSSFGCAATGGALALLQILPELRRDRWASLLHRPVSRGVIFSGKVLTGLLLYFGATALPFLASAAYTATPGQFAAPLVPGMLLPGLSDILAGPVFYFAALLLCLHRGRWVGSRGAAGLCAAAVFVLHLSTMWPLLLSLVFTLVFSSAAWGAMVGNGPLRTRPASGRVAFSIVVLIGSEAALFFLVWGLHWLPGQHRAVEEAYTQFEVARDGKVFISAQRPTDGTEVITDLDGKTVTDPKYAGNSARGAFCEMVPLCWDLRRGAGPSADDAVFLPRNSWNYVHSINLNEGSEAWYLLVAQNYFVGYDKLSRRRVGICDADGFKAPGAVPRPFPFPLRSAIIYFREPHLFWSGTQILTLEFAERRRVTLSIPDKAINGASILSDGIRLNQPEHLAVALNDEVRIFDLQGTLQLRIAYHHNPATWPFLSVTTSSDANRFYLQFSPALPWIAPATSGSPKESTLLDEIDQGGSLLRTDRLPKMDVAPPPAGWAHQAAILASPGLLALTSAFSFHDVSLSDRLHSALFGLVSSFPPVAPPATPAEFAGLFVFAAVLGIFTLRLARGIGFSAASAWRWAVFVFCFGLPGLIAFRLSADWPTRARCPHCRHKRPIGMENCPYCHQRWPSPQPTGVEIFGSGEVEVAPASSAV